MQVPLQELFGRLLTKQSILTERAPTLKKKKKKVLLALVSGTLILLMLLSASLVTTSQDARKNRESSAFEHYLAVPLSPLIFVLRLHFLQRGAL